MTPNVIYQDATASNVVVIGSNPFDVTDNNVTAAGTFYATPQFIQDFDHLNKRLESRISKREQTARDGAGYRPRVSVAQDLRGSGRRIEFHARSNPRSFVRKSPGRSWRQRLTG